MGGISFILLVLSLVQRKVQKPRGELKEYGVCQSRDIEVKKRRLCVSEVLQRNKNCIMKQHEEDAESKREGSREEQGCWCS